MDIDTSPTSAPREGPKLTFTDVLCFAAVALVTWAGCAMGLVCWFAVSALGDLDVDHLGGALDRLSRLAELGMFAALAPAVALAVLAVSWRRAAGASRVGTAILAITLVVAAPAAVTIPGKLVVHESPPSGVLFSDGDDHRFDSAHASAIGTIMPFVDRDADVPSGWLLADGRSLSRETHRELFAVLGTEYGGDGDEFRLPDYRGMQVVDLGLPSAMVTGLVLRPVPETLWELTGEPDAYRVVDVRWLIRVGK